MACSMHFETPTSARRSNSFREDRMDSKQFQELVLQAIETDVPGTTEVEGEDNDNGVSQDP